MMLSQILRRSIPGYSDVFGIEEPLSISSIYIEDIDFLNIDSSI